MFKFPEKRLDCKIFTKELNLWRLVNNYKIYDKGSRKKSFFFLFFSLKIAENGSWQKILHTCKKIRLCHRTTWFNRIVLSLKQNMFYFRLGTNKRKVSRKLFFLNGLAFNPPPPFLVAGPLKIFFLRLP